MNETVSTTRLLASHARAIVFDDLPDDIVEVAKHCLLDWLGVTLAGSTEPLAEILRRQLLPKTEVDGESTLLLAAPRRTSALLAALVNGATSHALDFDDTHTTMSGHPSAPVIPAALAEAEASGASGRAFLAAVVAGIELECRLGAIMNPAHYLAGFHATGTLGTFGAAAAGAHLLGLDEERWLCALGLAGTQGAGLKSGFGTMAKPFHAGKAAHDGLLAARLAAGGFTANRNIVEARQGFAHTCHGGDPSPARIEGLADRFCIRDTLFKYHAACYLTHSAIEGAGEIRRGAKIHPENIAEVAIEVPPSSLDVCNIESPDTGLEGKFSLRATTAMALLGDDTADLSSYSDERMRSHELVAMRDRVRVCPQPGTSPTATPIVLSTLDGSEYSACVDVGEAAPDLRLQRKRLEQKFLSLATPVIGSEAAEELLLRASVTETLNGLDSLLTPAVAAI